MTQTISTTELPQSQDKETQGRTYTSNTTKLLKHMNRLQLIQDGKRPMPVMIHLSIANPCNLTCSFCCFANRNLKEMLTIDQIKSALKQFRDLGVQGVEFTGGGEPTLHPKFDEAAQYAYDLGYKLGCNTNGSRLSKVKTWHLFSWIRLGMYGFDEGYDYDLPLINQLPNTEVSACYVWDNSIETSTNPNITGNWLIPDKKILSKNFQKEENFFRMLKWVEENKIPTRIAFNAAKPHEIIKQDMDKIRSQMAKHEAEYGPLKYAFLSDFNFKGDRRNDHCYIHMVKPYVYTDGNVYVCPSAELSPENLHQVNEQFKLCTIEGITDFYNTQVGGAEVTRRHHGCQYCKYAMQNELIDDILTETHHNEFA